MLSAGKPVSQLNGDILRLVLQCLESDTNIFKIPKLTASKFKDSRVNSVTFLEKPAYSPEYQAVVNKLLFINFPRL